MRAALPVITPALHHVKEMRNDARLLDELAVLVEVEAPRIARALGEYFELMFGGMITPHRGIDPLALLFGVPGLPTFEGQKTPCDAVEPAVRSPLKGVQRLVRVARVVPAIEKNLRVTGRRGIVPILHRHEHEVRRGADEHAAETHFDARDEIELVEKHGALVVLAIAVGVFEDEDAIVAAEDVGELFLRWRGTGIGGNGGRRPLRFGYV